jgi:hypothetical protein
MADLYRRVPCDGCAEQHDLYDTSALRHAPGGTYSYACPKTHLVVRVWWLAAPETVPFVPDGAVPICWVCDGPAPGGS